MKIGYLAAILKRYKYFIYFFSWNMIVISVNIYGVKIILKFRTNGRLGYLMQLSDKLGVQYPLQHESISKTEEYHLKI